jgi:hypothetical protein
MAPGVYSASSRNEYLKIFLEVKSGWQPNRHLWADCLNNEGSSTSHEPVGLHYILQE